MSISSTNAWPTVELRASSPILRTVKLKRMWHLLSVSGVLQPISTVSTIPEKRMTLNPGPKESASIRPSTTPRGVGNFWIDRILVKGPSVW